MDKKNYPNSGALFNRKKSSERAADMGGDLTFEGDVLDYILQCVNNREPVKIELAAWRRSSNSAGGWLSLKAEIPYEIRKPKQQGGYSQQREEYRGGRQDEERYPSRQREEYRGQAPDYNPRHDTQIGGSQRDYRGGRGNDQRDDRDFPPRGRGGLDRL